jgi:hypothetical protein
MCWFAFGDGDGVTGVKGVMHWAGCDEQKARRLLTWFVEHGYAETDGDDCFKAFEFTPDIGFDLSAANKFVNRQKVSKAMRAKVFDRDGSQCTYCGDVDGPFHIDHIHPISKGGSNSIENLTVSCWSCNLSKGCKTMSEWDDCNAQF